MPRYIDADALISKLAYHRDGLDHNNVTAVSVLNNVIEIIERRPTLSPDDVRGVGEWEHQELAPTNWTFCSVCGRQRSKKYKWYYCPNCGAKMEVSEDTRKN